ncbi:MAG: DEAD/DEAH box helicase [Candidatus Thermoplasmatota archaeon]|nr:DEAD/DEAH box helicase [Candidatus Thermoplasmatota archaeon]
MSEYKKYSVVLLDYWQHTGNMADVTMSINDLDLPEKARKFIITEWGIETLHPPQAQSMGPIFSGSSSLIAIPTASGKSLIAYIAIIRKLLLEEIGSKAVYIVPLKALATEKYDELKSLGEALNLTIGLGIGDATSETKKINECDILVCTSEKLDSLMRNRSETMSNVSIIVADEFHLLNDASRGPTLEINLTKLRHLKPKAQIVALSATVGNCTELANWLNAELIISDWRPVALEYSTYHDLHLEPRLVQSSARTSKPSNLKPPRDLTGPKSHPTWVALDDSIDNGGQLLIFVGTRKSAESEAIKLAKRVRKKMLKEFPEKISKFEDVASSIEGHRQSAMADKLIECVKGGTAFHHAGLTHGQRKIVEQAFKDGLITCLTATPTLAAGVNLPARRVLVRDIKRWDDGMSRPLPVMEVRQMLGRAGRPKYDDFGEAWVLCKGTDGWEIADMVSERYFFGEVEPIVSKLSGEPALRTHILSIIASGGIQHRGDIGDFFSATFLGHSTPNHILSSKIDETVKWLIEERFIRKLGIDEDYLTARENQQLDSSKDWNDSIPAWATAAQGIPGVEVSEQVDFQPESRTSAYNKVEFGFSPANNLNNTGAWRMPEDINSDGMRYEATPMGERITQLYLDPLSASVIRTGLRRAVRRLVKDIGPVTNFGLLHLATATPDFTSLWAKNSEMDTNSKLWIKTNSVEEELLSDSTYDEMLLSNVKSAWMVEMWASEENIRSIEKELDVNPGDIHYRVDIMEWLVHASREVILTDDVFSEEHMTQIASIVKQLDVLRLRVRHGCKEDLLALVNIPNVGRMRARELSKLGIRNPNDVAKMSKKQISEVLRLRGWGPQLLDKIMLEVNKVLKKSGPRKKPVRRDDIPLDSESEADY